MEDTRFKSIRRTLSTIVLITILLALIAPVVAGDYENDETIGVLVLAHGSSNESWCSPVRNATDEVDLPSGRTRVPRVSTKLDNQSCSREAR